MAGRDDDVLPFGDDLTCGPINSDAAAWVAWWQPLYEDAIGEHFQSFWRRIDESEDRLVVRFGRHYAQELAFRLAFAFHMNGRAYDDIDVTDLRIPGRQTDNGTLTSAGLVSTPLDYFDQLLLGHIPRVAKNGVRNRGHDGFEL